MFLLFLQNFLEDLPVIGKLTIKSKNDHYEVSKKLNSLNELLEKISIRLTVSIFTNLYHYTSNYYWNYILV